MLPTESQQILGGEKTIPGPQHIRRHHRDQGKGSGTYTPGAAHQLISIDKESPLLAVDSPAPQWTPGGNR